MKSLRTFTAFGGVEASFCQIPDRTIFDLERRFGDGSSLDCSFGGQHAVFSCFFNGAAWIPREELGHHYWNDHFGLVFSSRNAFIQENAHLCQIGTSKN